jgi:CheY-like chemotaxis protein
MEPASERRGKWEAGKNMSGRYALIVEDNDDIARFVTIVLNQIGFTVEVASDGPAALARLAEKPPDLVVLDLNIPKVSGVEVLHRIRADERLTGTKVVVVSANPHMIDESYDLADLVLQKPVSYNQLHDLIARLV